MFQNRISLIAFTGTDAQVRTTKNNRTSVVLSVATKRSWLDKQPGERVSRTEWHRVIAWDKLSDCRQELGKGLARRDLRRAAQPQLHRHGQCPAPRV